MFRSALIGLLGVVAVLILPQTAKAEYADVVINNYSDAAGMRPVVFPHWYHRIRFRCKVCHADLGFAFKAGGNKITMAKIIDGQFCGACHNGEISWSFWSNQSWCLCFRKPRAVSADENTASLNAVQACSTVSVSFGRVGSSSCNFSCSSLSACSHLSRDTSSLLLIQLGFFCIWFVDCKAGFAPEEDMVCPAVRASKRSSIKDVAKILVPGDYVVQEVPVL